MHLHIAYGEMKSVVKQVFLNLGLTEEKAELCAALKARFEEEIAREVVRYMILKTIVALRLTTWKKVDEYIGRD